MILLHSVFLLALKQIFQFESAFHDDVGIQVLSPKALSAQCEIAAVGNEKNVASILEYCIETSCLTEIFYWRRQQALNNEIKVGNDQEKENNFRVQKLN